MIARQAQAKAKAEAEKKRIQEETDAAERQEQLLK
jgi:hypothetical protein